MIFGAALSVGRASDLHEKPHSCSPRCRNLAKVRRHRSGYTDSALTAIREKRLQTVQPTPGRLTEIPTPRFNPHGPTPGALQGDDYGLEYYEDGYPKLPACLDRRPKLPISEAA